MVVTLSSSTILRASPIIEWEVELELDAQAA
jgi:hypothetical protein